MEFKELIQKRRSVRAYSEPAPHDVIREILIQAQQAPSWAHTQNARCYVVESPEMLEDFRKAVLPEFNQKNSENAALIVTTFVRGLAGFSRGMQVNEPGEEWGAYDLGMHDAYLIFAARDAGYVSVFSHTSESAGVSIKGLKYSLEDAVLTNTFPLGVSNEFVDEVVEISVRSGARVRRRPARWRSRTWRRRKVSRMRRASS